ANGSFLTLHWRKTDSNSRSLREGKGCRQPRQASIAVFGPELVSGSAFRAAVSDCNAQKSLSQERDRWFEFGSLLRGDAMGRAARMAISSLTSIDGVPRCPSRTI